MINVVIRYMCTCIDGDDDDDNDDYVDDNNNNNNDDDDDDVDICMLNVRRLFLKQCSIMVMIMNMMMSGY